MIEVGIRVERQFTYVVIGAKEKFRLMPAGQDIEQAVIDYFETNRNLHVKRRKAKWLVTEFRTANKNFTIPILGLRMDTGFPHEVRISQGQINRAIAEVIDEIVEQTLTLVLQDISLILGISHSDDLKGYNILRDTIDYVVFKGEYRDVVELQDRIKVVLDVPIAVEK